METWKKIPDYDYEVSDLGNLRSMDKTITTSTGNTVNYKGKLRKPQVNSKGYVNAVLFKNGKATTYSLHQLVATLFIPNPNNYPEINHIDGNKSNNSVSNLEWCTHSQNQMHSFRTKLHPKVGSSKYYHVSKYNHKDRPNRKWSAAIRYNGKMFGQRTFLTEEDAARHADYLLDLIGDTSRPRNFPKAP